MTTKALRQEDQLPAIISQDKLLPLYCCPVQGWEPQALSGVDTAELGCPRQGSLPRTSCTHPLPSQDPTPAGPFTKCPRCWWVAGGLWTAGHSHPLLEGSAGPGAVTAPAVTSAGKLRNDSTETWLLHTPQGTEAQEDGNTGLAYTNPDQSDFCCSYLLCFQILKFYSNTCTWRTGPLQQRFQRQLWQRTPSCPVYPLPLQLQGAQLTPFCNFKHTFGDKFQKNPHQFWVQVTGDWQFKCASKAIMEVPSLACPRWCSAVIKKIKFIIFLCLVLSDIMAKTY